jgi:glyceraldehyde-3-phosphate dehydrogenase/erythrose-4-phosphate dehydrogenase
MRLKSILVLLLLSGAGCNRQDIDGLGRIGRRVLERTQSATSPLREKFDHTLQGIGTLGLRQRVQHRLQWDKTLADTTIDVAVTDKEVELRGTIRRDEQRRRAIELAESTVGVERVTDHLSLE